MELADNDNARQFTGRKMLIWLCAFFGVIIAVNLVLLDVALDSWTGLVARNGYVASQNFNKQMAAARAQEKLGWHAELDYRPGVLEIRYLDADGAPLTGLDLAGRVGRPVTERDDHDVVFHEPEAGLYRTAVDLGAGVWEIDSVAHDGAGDSFRRILRFSVPDPAK